MSDADTGGDSGSDVTAPPPLQGSCNSAGWCWQYPLPQGNTLRAGWALAANDVWAVGDGGSILHWDGQTWTSRRVPNVNEEFWSIWASGPSDVWLGGYGNAYHWNGSTWAQTGPYRAFSISGTSSSNVWAAVDSGTGAMRYDGTSWKGVVLPSTQTTGCSSVVAIAANDVWLACEQLFHYDGVQYTAFNMIVYQLAASGAADVWAIEPGAVTKYWHWNGQQWSTVTVPASDDIQAFWPRSSSDIWAVGRYGSVHHNDGRGWFETRAEDSVLRTFLVGSGTTDLWMGGDYGLLFRGNGTSWTPTTETTGSPPTIYSVWAASADVAWAASSDGLMRRQGGKWVQVPGSAGTMYFDVWGSGPNDVWAVGSGVLSRWNGSALVNVSDSPVAQSDASIIAGSAADNVWFVGQEALNRWDGSGWTTVSFQPDPDRPVTDAWTSGRDDLWVVDRGGRIRRWNGSTFTVFKSGGGAIQAIWGATPNDVWVAADAASHWDGQSWTSTPLMPTTSVSDTSIDAIGGSAGNDVWAVIAGGYAFHWDGGIWREYDAASGGGVNSVWVTPDHGAFIGGSGPTILYRAP